LASIDANITNGTALQDERSPDLAGIDRDNSLALFPRFATTTAVCR
jgi:hypothetical protein